MDQKNLVFVVCTPRSGSTLLQRMLGSHTQIATHPEPHLITPLAYLGYYDTVDKAPFDHINAAEALKEFCQELPGGEADYLQALRTYALTLYDGVRSSQNKPLFLDKTPAYALVLPFLRKLFPHARYVVLTRHPFAILHSAATSFFEGDYRRSNQENPIVSQYVPAIAAFLRDPPQTCVHVRYEDLVQEPAQHLARICAAIDLPFEEAMVEYGQHKHITKSYGDPFGVGQHQKPVANSLHTWAGHLLQNPDHKALCQELADSLADEDLAAFGFAKDTLFAPLAEHGEAALASPSKSKSKINAYRLKRQLLLGLRRNIHDNALGIAVKKLRYYCDVLLRT